MPRLGVNIDHVATIRQARGGREPDPVWAAVLAELAGADGITVHLREDRRHIQDRDLRLLRETVRTRLNLEMSVEPEIVAHYRPRDGFVVIAGATGNGKTTLQAAMTRDTIEDPDSHAAILTYEAPIEFVFDEITGPTTTIEQTEIPRHLPSFAAGIRNAMRREPTTIIVGECRDGETMTAATNAALTGHAVYTTVHAASVAETMQRIVSLCGSHLLRVESP